MTFIRGSICDLRVLEETDEQARVWTQHVMHSNDHMRFVMTGSIPMRWIDVKEAWRKEREAGAVMFAVYAEDKFVGVCGLHSHREIYRSWEARFLIVDPDAIGKGIGTECTRLLTDYAFKKLNAHKVWLGLNAENLVAYKTYLTVGYKVDGTLRDDLWINGKYVDAIRMSCLEEEWTSSVESVGK